MSELGTTSSVSRRLDRLGELLGREAVSVVQGCAVARPGSDEEVAALMKVARQEGWSVLPSAGSAPAVPARRYAPIARAATEERQGPDLVISSESLAEVVEHEPADLVAKVGVGLPLPQLQERIEDAGQWLALDPPGGPETTVGQVVARGEAGPLRALYGRPRDQVLGLTLVDGRGRILRLGGRVVKNVAGFDLVRLAVGSLGTLGMITEATFRLHPRPALDRTLVWERGNLEDAWRLGRKLSSQPLPIAAAELLAGDWDPPLGEGAGASGDVAAAPVRVVLRLTGSPAAVDRMATRLSECTAAPDRVLEGLGTTAAFTSLASGIDMGSLRFRAHGLPDRGDGLLSALENLPIHRLALHLLEGTFRVSLRRELNEGETEILEEAARSAGARIVPVGPAFPRDSGAARLQATLVRSFDPGGILPGAWREGWIDGPLGRAARQVAGGVR